MHLELSGERSYISAKENAMLIAKAMGVASAALLLGGGVGWMDTWAEGTGSVLLCVAAVVGAVCAEGRDAALAEGLVVTAEADGPDLGRPAEHEPVAILDVGESARWA